MRSQPTEVWILLVALAAAMWLILFMAKQLRELREDNHDLRGANEALLRGADDAAPDVHVFDPPPGTRFGEDGRTMDGWYQTHPSVDEQRETQARKVSGETTIDWIDDLTESGNR